MKKPSWHFVFVLSLVLISIALYSLQIQLFHKTKDTFFYIFQDLAFLPIYVVIVTLIVDGVLQSREQQSMLNKLNMVIGAFFSEVGNDLIRVFQGFNGDAERTSDIMKIKMDWTEKDILAARKMVKSRSFDISCGRGDLEKLKRLLLSKRPFFLRLLENPNLLEHDTFTDLLWAVFHLTEELEFRREPKGVCGADAEHLSNDMKRCFSQLVYEWLSYMKHLKREYPYLYSLSVRMNPFDPEASAEIQGG